MINAIAAWCATVASSLSVALIVDFLCGWTEATVWWAQRYEPPPIAIAIELSATKTTARIRPTSPSAVVRGGGGWRYRVNERAAVVSAPGGKTALPLPLWAAPRPTPLFSVVRIRNSFGAQRAPAGPG